MEKNVNLGQKLGRKFDDMLGMVLGGLFIVWALSYLFVRDTWEKVKAWYLHLVDVGNPDSALNKQPAKVFYPDLSPSPLVVKKPRKNKTSKATAAVTKAVEKSEEVTKRIKLPSKVALTIPPPAPTKKKQGRPKKTKAV